MIGLNHVLFICMGLSLGADTIYLGCNMGGMNCLNVGDGSQCFSYQCSKSWLPHSLCNCLTQGREIRHGQQKVLHVSTKSKLKMVHEHNLILWNMSHVSCLNLEAYTGAKCDPWRIVHNLLIVVCFSFELLKKTPNFWRNASKSFRRGNWCSKRGANHVKVVPDNKVPMNPTWVRSIG
jgi:hypothetical protein